MYRGEELARRFHRVYEELAPMYGYETREDTRDFDPKSNNGRLMIAVMERLAPELEREAINAFIRTYQIPNTGGTE